MKIPYGSLQFVVFALTLISWQSTAAQTVSIPFVTIGNPGNFADSDGFGSVGYAYNMGADDVTLSEYCTFLNDVAASDPYGLYNPRLGSDGNVEGILRSGTPGNYSYAVIGSSGNDPVTYVSWLDSARFCNWLQNEQPIFTGTSWVVGGQVVHTGADSPTETGAYTLNGDMDYTLTTGTETRNVNATYWIPSENEWYKAAYFDPMLASSGGYWSFATQSNSIPGNLIGNGLNEANFYNGVYCTSQSSIISSSQSYLTAVGTFSNAASSYGTYDQSGDVFQWNDSIYGGNRGVRGGSWLFGSTYLESSYSGNEAPDAELSDIGFRIAMASSVPEPGCNILVIAGILGITLRRLGRRTQHGLF